MESADDELAELADLTRRLRDQMLRHATLGAWAAPGGPTLRANVSPEDTADEPEALGAPASDAAPGAIAVPVGSVGATPVGAVSAAAIAPAVAASSAAAAAATMSVPADPALADEPLTPLGRKTLAQIRDELGDCKRCKLHSTRKNIVFGVGDPHTPLMFVGEAPGEQEDRRGEPFVGPAGQLLDKMIEAMGWTRDTVYIANTTKCRPPSNRNPQPDELEQCMPFLHAQIEAIAPRVIVALGRPASNQLLGTDAPISALRGRFHDYARSGSDGHGLKIMPTFHPAYLLRDPDKKRTAWADLKLVMAELARLGIAAPHAR
jgi:uracil-DNA glycosylase family 4